MRKTLPLILAQLKITNICTVMRSSTSSVKHHIETHIIKNIVIKESKGLNGDLKPEHMKSTNMTAVRLTTDIDHQAPTI